MKELQISIHFEYAEHLQELLDEQGVEHYVVISGAAGRDTEGKHDGSQIFPGTLTLIVAQLEADHVEPIFEQLRRFRDAKSAHHHLEAVVVPVEARL